jgi:ribonuclease HI
MNDGFSGPNVVVYARGYRRSSLSDAALAVCLFVDGSMTAQRTKYLPGRSWTGIAEYRAAISGLELAASEGVRALELITSSQLVFDQMTGHREVRGQDFVLRASRIDVLSESFSAVHWRYIATSKNPADSMAREAFAAGPLEDGSRRLRSGAYGTNGRTGGA